MAGGKLTPRQKMINMMYLVLTAMLALNVSVEVLDAFVLINKSLKQSIETTRIKNKAELSDFARAAAENPEKVKPWQDKAEEVHTRAEELYIYIQHLKVQIVKASDGEDAPALEDDGLSFDSWAIEGKDNTDVASRILLGDGNGEAYTIRKKITDYKEFLLAMSAGNTMVTESIHNLLQTDNPPEGSDGMRRTWETQFESIPLISAISLLSKFQLDILNCESEVLNHLSSQIDASDFKFSNIDVAVIPTSNYVLKGTEYSAEIFLAAYDPTARPTLQIGGRTYQANQTGKITYKYQAQTVGPVNLKGAIEFSGPDGKTTRPVTIQFQVAEPNVVVSPTKMNVVYRGIENPISISLSGVPPEKLIPTVTNGTITRGTNEFILTPGSGNLCKVSVAFDGKDMGGMTFRVKNLPVPTPRLEGITTKTATKGDLMASQGIFAEMKDFDFDLKYRVTSFTVSATIQGYLEEKASNSQLFTEEQKQLFNRVRSGQLVAFTNIIARGPNGDVELPDLTVKVR
ncbi:MAG: gliding motility protein GldM [Prevotellaceae bacterium]|jgi:gliding motility-associated protein GldM|nr:gliding motility protein GldM [Prevotellaceae bacterium]